MEATVTAEGQPLPLGPQAIATLDQLRGAIARSTFLERLLDEEQQRRNKGDFITAVNSAYTAEVCEETLRVNQSFPISEG